MHPSKDKAIFKNRQQDPVAQLVEHLTFNEVVLGSNPSRITTKNPLNQKVREDFLFLIKIRFVLIFIHFLNPILLRFTPTFPKIQPFPPSTNALYPKMDAQILTILHVKKDGRFEIRL